MTIDTPAEMDRHASLVSQLMTQLRYVDASASVIRVVRERASGVNTALVEALTWVMGEPPLVIEAYHPSAVLDRNAWQQDVADRAASSSAIIIDTPAAGHKDPRGHQILGDLLSGMFEERLMYTTSQAVPLRSDVIIVISDVIGESGGSVALTDGLSVTPIEVTAG